MSLAVENKEVIFINETRVRLSSKGKSMFQIYTVYLFVSMIEHNRLEIVKQSKKT